MVIDKKLGTSERDGSDADNHVGQHENDDAGESGHTWALIAVLTFFISRYCRILSPIDKEHEHHSPDEGIDTVDSE